MMADQTDDYPVHTLLARAGMLRWLAAGFFYPVTAHAATWNQQYQALDWETLRAQLPDLPLTSAAQLAQIWGELDETGLQPEYSRLFLGQDAIPLRETAYSDARRMAGRSSELADINGFYLAFGIEMNDDAADAADHLSAELEFLSALLIKEAYALNSDLSEALEITQGAITAFLREHLGIWPDALTAALREAAPTSPYTPLAELIEAVIDFECQLRAVQPVELGQRSPDFMQDEEFTCPLSSGDA